MATVRAKFKVDSIFRSQTSRTVRDESGRCVTDEKGHVKYEPCEVRTVVLSPVYGDGDPDHENTKFFHATPSGKIELGCVNLEAAERFELGREYYVDFSPCEHGPQ